MTTSAPKIIWFNKGLSAIAQALKLLKGSGNEFKTICTHTNPKFVGFEFADTVFVEPRAISGNEYIEYALEFCKTNSVDVFWPGRFQIEVTKNRARFEELGITIITPASASVLDTIENKAELYKLVSDISPIPMHTVVGDYNSFWYAYQSTKAAGHPVCIKPETGIFAQGFRVIIEGQNLLQTLFKHDEFSVDFESLNNCLKRYNDTPFHHSFMVMQFLVGAELSCDCVAFNGELDACVIREKPTNSGDGQFIVDNPVVEDIIGDIVKRLELDGPFNIQFKYDNGEPYLLEINSRLSGGILISCESGINFPALAIHSALASKRDFVLSPSPEYGVRVHDLPSTVISTKRG